MMPQGATKSCSLCVCLHPNWARSFRVIVGKLAVDDGIACLSCRRSNSTSPLLSTRSSKLSSKLVDDSVLAVSEVEAVELFRNPICARFRCSRSWNCDCPWSLCIFSVSWCAGRWQTLLPDCKVSLTVSLKMHQSCLWSRLISEKSSTTWRC